MPSVITARNLEKSFSRGRSPRARVIRAVHPLSFSVEAGEFIGFLGPNGAGKSTTIKMMTGILHPSGGEVIVDGLSPQRERVALAYRLGIVFGQRTQLWWDLPLIESYRLLRVMYRVTPADYRIRMDRLTDLLDLDRFWLTPVRQLSLGQRMRAELAAALLHRPRILFLDEPTIGLDVTAKAAVRTFLREENRREGTTIVLTTHDMTDVEELCSRLIVMHQGAKMFDGAVAALEDQVGMLSAVQVLFRAAPAWAMATLPAGMECTVADDGRTAFIQYNRKRFSPAQILGALTQLGEIEDFHMEEPHLESIMRLLYHNLGEPSAPPEPSP
jgi:ABC-2 type transport system ATP-binding protein